MEPLETYELNFGTFERYPEFILGIPHKYVHMGVHEAREINRLIGCHYKTNYGYISDRKHNTSVDPIVYFYANKENPLLKAVAIVAYSKPMTIVADIEKRVADMSDLQFKLFKDQPSAIDWVKIAIHNPLNDEEERDSPL